MSAPVTVNLGLTITPFSVNPTWTLEEFHQAVLGSITTSTTTSNVLLGQIGGSAPASNVGLWLNSGALYAWDSVSSSYKPATIQVGGATFQVTLSASPTANRAISLPDASGTLALTSDLTRATVSPTVSATTTINWALSSSFAIALDKDITIANSNSLPGQEITIAIHNPAAWTVTWPSDVKFSGADPVQSTGGKTDVYYLRNVGGTIYARYNQDLT